MFSNTFASCLHTVSAAGVDGAAVTLTFRGRTWEPVAATDAIAQQIDDTHYLLGEGPAIDADTHSRASVIADLNHPNAFGKWPAFTDALIGLNVGAVVAVPIIDSPTNRALGVLHLYRRNPGSITADDLLAAWERARHVSTTIMGDLADLWETDERVPRDERLATYMTHYSDIEKAAGIAGELLQLSAGDALTTLRAYSFRSRTPLKVLAETVVTTERLPHDYPR